MNHLVFFVSLLVLLILIIFLDVKYQLLRDITTLTTHKPFSYSRVQLAWWTWIIVTSFIAVLFDKDGAIPKLDNSTLILLGITTGTTSIANIIDVSDSDKTRHQNESGKSLLYDIIADANGASIHRLQAVLFNIIFGIWMLAKVYSEMDCIPKIDPNSLVLLGISAGAYSVIKTSENKPMANNAPEVK